MKVDHLIVGQGLAGSLLAWHLVARGCRILVVDRDEPVTSSKVAAGLVNPLPGRHFALAPDLEDQLLTAQRTYWEIEEYSGQVFFHYVPIARLFRGEKEEVRWRRKREDPDYRSRTDPLVRPLEIGAHAVSPRDGIEVHRGGWLDVPVFLEAIRQFLLERLSYAIGSVDAADLVRLEPGVRWRNVEAKTIIFCEGWRGSENVYFRKIPMNNIRGDILTFASEGLVNEARILNRDGWIVPLGGGRFRAGATYDRDFCSPEPTGEGRSEVERKIRGLIQPSFEVSRHDSGVRPVISRSEVYLGRHPEHSEILYCNGFGSKGVLQGPLRTRELADHLVTGKPLAPERDIREQDFFA